MNSRDPMLALVFSWCGHEFPTFLHFCLPAPRAVQSGPPSGTDWFWTRVLFQSVPLGGPDCTARGAGRQQREKAENSCPRRENTRASIGCRESIGIPLEFQRIPFIIQLIQLIQVSILRLYLFKHRSWMTVFAVPRKSLKSDHFDTCRDPWSSQNDQKIRISGFKPRAPPHCPGCCCQGKCGFRMISGRP